MAKRARGQVSRKAGKQESQTLDTQSAICYWSLEHELLLRCCQPKLNDYNVSEIYRILESRLNWQRVQHLSFIHELSPILYFHLSRLSEKKQSPGHILNRLRKQWLDNSLQNMIYLAELGTVLREAAKVSVPVVVLKLSLLLETVYQELGMRVLNDLDILVKIEDLPKIESLLSDLGYSYHGTNLGNHNRYFSTEKGIILEVHWALVNAHSPVQKYAFKLDMDEIWKEVGVQRFNRCLSGCEIAETEALTLSLEHSIIYLCVHFFKEDFGSFKWLGDISGILHYYRNVIDWDKFCDYVAKFQLNKIVYYILDFIAQRLGAPVPKRVLRSIQPDHVRSIDRKLINPIADPRFIERYKPIRYLTVIADIREKILALTKIMSVIRSQISEI